MLGEPSRAVPNQHTILVVDDEPAVRRLVCCTLEDAGYHTSEAADGVAALVAATETRPDLIVLDIALPRLSGLEVCRRLREQAGLDTPVLLVSGLDEPLEGLAEEGVAGRIVKPFSPASLLERVSDALTKSAAPLP